MVFVKAQDLIPASIGLRSLNRLKTAHTGLYMQVRYDPSQSYLVLGTVATPVTTPKGITVNEDPKRCLGICHVMKTSCQLYKPLTTGCDSCG